jgi:hypothetical protein
MALFGHAGAVSRCPLLEAERTSRMRPPTSENDPSRTSSPRSRVLDFRTERRLTLDGSLLAFGTGQRFPAADEEVE